MTKRIITFILALATVIALAAGLTGCGERASAVDLPTPSAGLTDAPETRQIDPVETPSPSPTPTPEPEPVSSVALNFTDHVAYIQGDGQGMFAPDNYITRAEAAVILCRLLSETVPVTVSYTDVPASSWYAEAAGQMGSLGVIRPNKSTFNGSEIISRGEFVSYIACFFTPRTDAEQFPDVRSDYAYRDAILSARAWGWVVGLPDGTFGPGAAIHRSEAVTIINRALGRTGDQTSIAANRPALFLDVPVTEWYYYEVMEATVPHTYTANESGGESWSSFTQANTGLPEDFRTQGLHLYQGWSYFYDGGTKDIARNTTVSGFPFDADGHFTTGDAKVDEQLREIVLSQTSPGMTGDEMLRAFFAYCRDNYKYLKWNLYATGDTSFTLDAARQMLSTGRGNCYCYASVFWYLARWIGYYPAIYSGGVLGGPHCWVEINGYIYDTQLEWRYVHDWGYTGYLWTFYQLKDTSDTFRYRK